VARSRFGAVLRGGGRCLLASFGVATGIVVAAGGFGAGDLAAFAAWTAPFSLATGGAAAALGPPLSRVGPWAGLALAGLAAVALAVLWTIAVGLLLGPFFLAFSFPVFPCWLAGAAAGLASGAGAGSEWQRTASVVALVAPVVVFVASTALLALAPVGDDRDVDVVAYFRAGATPGEIDAFADTELAAVEGVEGVSPVRFRDLR
jgi:hypothetical protein